MFRQIGVMTGLAASVALGVAMALWSRTPDMSLLYASLPGGELAEIVAELEQAQIPHRVDAGSGAVLVAGDRVGEARMKLAASGLPKGVGNGFELLDNGPTFGSSRFIENARYQRALEGELARSIMALSNVRTARIHLAMPRQSGFVRDREKPSASVVVDLWAGRTLEAGQVEAIVHMVSASVPELETGKVAVIDDKGRLLSGRPGSDGLDDRQLDYVHRLEQSYVERIEHILAPVVGAEGVRAQVTAEVDFNQHEQTEERFNPDQPALRSEQVAEDRSQGVTGPIGIPGALSNQPPAAGVAPEQAVATGAAPAAAGAAQTTAAASQQAGSASTRATRNFEVDRTISHSRRQAGGLRRLAVAVVVDDRKETLADGTVKRHARSSEEIERIRELAREAVGFNALRGDTVNVVSTSFVMPEAPAELPEPPIWKQSWLWDVLRQVAGAAGVLLLIFGVLRPLMRGLVARRAAEAEAATVEGAVAAHGAPGAGMMALPGATGAALPGAAPALAQLEAPQGYTQRIDLARKAASDDPKRVAQVMKNWVAQ